MTVSTEASSPLPSSIEERAAWIVEAGGLNAAIDAGRLSEPITLPSRRRWCSASCARE